MTGAITAGTSRRAGRPRKEGDRYPGGRLKPPSTAGQSSLSPSQVAAANVYARHFEKSSADAYDRGHYERGGKVASRSDAYAHATDALRKARAVLEPPERAAMDMIAARGVSLKDLAARTGSSQAYLRQLFISACDRLATHYEGHGAA